MKILVTGGAGFIGSALIRHIINNTDHRVLNIDKLTYAGNLESLEEIKSSSRYKFSQVDICNKNDLDKAFELFKPNLVMHLAAESHVDRSIDGPIDFINTNIYGTYNILETSRNFYESHKSEAAHFFRFHHISTDEVYGDLPHPDYSSQQDSLGLFTENTPYNPSSPYSSSKASSDHLVKAWTRTFGLPTVITNCSNNYGPYHFPEKLIPLVILNALEGKKIPIYGKGDQIRDWLYVEDHVKALIEVALNGENGNSYNIGGNNEIRNIDVIKIICQKLSKLCPLGKNKNIKNSSIIKYSDLIEHVNDRPGHDLRYAIDASKIKKELNWMPSETFDTGITKTIKWYLENKEWCRRVQDGSYMRERLGDL